MLGENGTEQFTITTRVDGKVVREQKIHDPFLHTKTVVGISRWDLFGNYILNSQVLDSTANKVLDSHKGVMYYGGMEVVMKKACSTPTSDGRSDDGTGTCQMCGFLLGEHAQEDPVCIHNYDMTCCNPPTSTVGSDKL